MSNFIRSVGNVTFNGIGADLYENKAGTASIRFDKNTHPLPMRYWLTFTNLSDAEAFIERKRGSDGLNTLLNVIDSADL